MTWSFMKILIVDDDPDVRNFVSTVLKKRGYDVVEADDGTTGLQAAQAQLPDLIICDYLMSTMDGYEMVLALRKEPLTAEIPFILMTGEIERAGLRHSENKPPDDFLEKPVSASDLIRAVEARLPKK